MSRSNILPGRHRMKAIGIIALARFLWLSLLLSTVAGPAIDASAAPRTALDGLTSSPGRKNPVKAARKRPARDIQGFRAGMNMQAVKQLLRKKGIKAYETAFSDLFVFKPAFGTEIELRFACGGKGFILSKVKFNALFPADEADRAIAIYREKLVAKYGPPASFGTEQSFIHGCCVA